MRSYYGALLFLSLLAGCSSLSKEECAVGDWAYIGTQDARQGYEKSRFSDHLKACKKYDIVPDFGVYQQGYALGLQSYCTIENGFQVGRNGYTYKNICPVATEASFLRGYEKGTEIHQIETEIAEARRSISDAEQEIDELETIKDRAERRSKRFRIRLEIDRLERELERLHAQRDRALLAADRLLLNSSADL